MCAACECCCPRCIKAGFHSDNRARFYHDFKQACARGNATDAADWEYEEAYPHFLEKQPRHDTLAEIAERYVNAQEFHAMFQLVLDAARGCTNAAAMQQSANILLAVIAGGYGEHMADLLAEDMQ